jgi:histidine triad (HIT) family protein
MSIFKKIIDKEIPADIVYEDELCIAFKDINPQAPVHLVFIPKKEIKTVNDIQAVDQELFGHMMVKVSEIVASAGIKDSGYRLVVNTNDDGGQEVPHLHFHIIGGRKMSWPPG